MSDYTLFKDLVHTTIDFWDKDPQSHIGQHNAFFRYMQKNGNIKTHVTGGAQLRIPAIFNENKTMQNYAGFGTLNGGQSPIFDSLTFEWRQKAISVTMSGRMEAVNDGPAAMVNIVKAYMKNAKDTRDNRMAIEAMSDGSIADGLAGLKYMITDNGLGTVGGIDSSLTPNWANQWINAGAPLSITAAVVKKMFNKMWTLTQVGDIETDLVLCSNDIYTTVEESLQAQAQYPNPYMDSKTADFGWKGLKYKGATIIRDANVNFASNAERAYFLKTDNMYLYNHPKRNWKETEAMTPHNQDAWVVRLLWMGGFAIDGRRQQGVLFTS